MVVGIPYNLLDLFRIGLFAELFIISN